MTLTQKILAGVGAVAVIVFVLWLIWPNTTKAVSEAVTEQFQADSIKFDAIKAELATVKEDAASYLSTLDEVRNQRDSLAGIDVNGDTIPGFLGKPAIVVSDSTALPAPAPVVTPGTQQNQTPTSPTTKPTTPRAVLVSGKTTTLPYPRKGEFVVDSVAQKVWVLASDKGKITIPADYSGWTIGTKPR